MSLENEGVVGKQAAERILLCGTFAGMSCGQLWKVLDFVQRVPTNIVEIINIIV